MKYNSVTPWEVYMKFFKLFIAAAFFVTSVTFEEQILVSKAGIDSTWDVTFSTPVSHAAAAKAAF